MQPFFLVAGWAGGSSKRVMKQVPTEPSPRHPFVMKLFWEKFEEGLFRQSEQMEQDIPLIWCNFLGFLYSKTASVIIPE